MAGIIAARNLSNTSRGRVASRSGTSSSNAPQSEDDYKFSLYKKKRGEFSECLQETPGMPKLKSDLRTLLYIHTRNLNVYKTNPKLEASANNLIKSLNFLIQNSENLLQQNKLLDSLFDLIKQIGQLNGITERRFEDINSYAIASFITNSPLFGFNSPSSQQNSYNGNMVNSNTRRGYYGGRSRTKRRRSRGGGLNVLSTSKPFQL